MKKKLLVLVCAFAMCFALVGCGGSEVPEGDGDGKPAEEKQESGVYFKDGVLSTDEFKIEITDYKVIPVGEKGNEYGEKPVIAFWYNCTNVAGEDISADSSWIFAFTAIQDNSGDSVNELEVGMSPDDSLVDGSMETIKKGGTVKAAVAYELDDTKTPVTLVASETFGDEIGRQDFEIK